MSHRTTAAVCQYEMKVNATLLTTTIWVARRARPPPVGPAGPSVVDTNGPWDRRPNERARRPCRGRVGPFNHARGTPPAMPARLADGLGLESTPVRCRTCAP